MHTTPPQDLPDRKRTWVVPVPNPGSTDLGSGGATLHALVQVAERLSASCRDTFVNGARLRGKSILILHTAGQLAAWRPMPLLDEEQHAVTNVDMVTLIIPSIEPSQTHKKAIPIPR